MESSKKILLSTIGIAVLIVIVTGVTFAFFNYTRTGTSNNIKVGRISFVSKDEETITLSNLFPIDPENTTDMNDSTKVGTYQITIEGDTDYSGGIEYLVSTTNSNLSNLPISINMTVGNGLGTNDTNYFTSRDTATTPIYKKIVGSEIVGDQMLLVGFIPQNTTLGTSDETGDTITIKAYLDKNKILISDTYDGTESDNMGTLNSMADGKTVLTTTEWNALSSTGVSFKIKVEANEGIWVNGSLEEIMKTQNLNTTTNQPIMDNVQSEFVSASTGINFGAVSSSTNGQGIYMRAGTENDAYPIVYYRGAVENNNVVFNNKCWKAVRTTDTGGVKLIYNGESSAIYGEIPLTESQYTIPSGATNNFTFNSTDNSWDITITDNAAKEISFTVPAGDNYKLVQTGTSGSSCGGSFTFYKNGTSVNGGSNGGGEAMNLTHNFGTLASTDVIKMNYSGSSSSTCEITFKLQMMQPGDLITENGCANTGTDTHISLSGTNMFAFNTSYNSPAYVGYMYGDVYTYNSGAATSGAYYGSSFTYDGTNYTLVDPVTTKNNTHHYTCNLTTADGTCATIRYYYYGNYYVNLTGGDSIERAMEKMQANTNNSNAKDKIDTWYASNMNTVTSKLEDTIWCNDRSVGNGNNNGWIANGGDLSTDLNYGAYQRSNYASNSSTVKKQPSLACTNKNDAFTVSNGNGNQKLTYPVALLTEDEMVLAGGLAGSSSTFYLNNGSTYYWSLSPSDLYDNHANEFFVTYGNVVNYFVSGTAGLRPSVSLKPGMPVISGDGTVSDPYVIE